MLFTRGGPAARPRPALSSGHGTLHPALDGDGAAALCHLPRAAREERARPHCPHVGEPGVSSPQALAVGGEGRGASPGQGPNPASVGAGPLAPPCPWAVRCPLPCRAPGRSCVMGTVRCEPGAGRAWARGRGRSRCGRRDLAGFTRALQLTLNPDFANSYRCVPQGSGEAAARAHGGFAFRAALHGTARLVVRSVWQAEAWEEKRSC